MTFSKQTGNRRALELEVREGQHDVSSGSAPSPHPKRGPETRKALLESSKEIIETGFTKWLDVPADSLRLDAELEELQDGSEENSQRQGNDAPAVEDVDSDAESLADGIRQELRDFSKEALEELQIKTIFSLVDPVVINQNNKKLLFLTDKQAHGFVFSQMEKVLLNMDIPQDHSLGLSSTFFIQAHLGDRRTPTRTMRILRQPR